MPSWLLLITNLPGRNQTLRMRLWRALKTAGAASLRDGVYLLPGSERARLIFEALAGEIRSAKGSVFLLPFVAESVPQSTALQSLFDRSANYAEVGAQIRLFKREIARLDELTARRGVQALRRSIAQIADNDFFPGAPREQTEAALVDAEAALTARYSPDEPHGIHRKIVRRTRSDYCGRVWATREHLWVDRVCSAWLIRRFIDPKARFMWLKRIKDLPKRAVGFDFDGAEFTHVDAKVSFEVLLASFGLEQDHGLARIAELVHFLDVGGVPIPEAAGLATIITGARALQRDDDALLKSVAPVLDSMYAAYSLPAGA